MSIVAERANLARGAVRNVVIQRLPRRSPPEVVELAEAVDQYKLRHRRRFITFEELFDVMASLGYHK